MFINATGVLLTATTLVSAFNAAQTSTGTTVPKTLKLSGCVQVADSDTKESNVSGFAHDPETGTMYAFSGVDMHKYVGKRIAITGGLVPSPNIAAQAGALDPSRAIIYAGTPGGLSTEPVKLPVFRIDRLLTIPGQCP